VRARLLNAGFTCLFFLILFFGVNIWQRNEDSMANIESQLKDDFKTPLEKEVVRLRGLLPVEFPMPGEDDRGPARRYNYPSAEDVRILRRILQQATEAIVGHTGRVSLFFRGDRYCVVLYHQGASREDWSVSVEWWPEEEFRSRIRAQKAWMADERARLESRHLKPLDLP